MPPLMHSKFNFKIKKRNENILENAYNLIKKYLRKFIYTITYIQAYSHVCCLAAKLD